MRQPIYKFGDVFSKKVRAKFEGNARVITVDHYVIKITATSTDRGFTYYYVLGNCLPEAYREPTWKTDPIEECDIIKVYNEGGVV